MATAKGEATRARILEAAVDLLVAGGVDRLNLDDVLEMTHTSKGQLFYYFPGGKDELCLAATERQVQRLLAHCVDLQLDTWAAWQDWFEQMLALHRVQTQDHKCEVAAIAGRASDSDPRSRSIIGGAFDTWHRQIVEQLTSMQERGDLRQDAVADELASAVLAALEGGAVLDRATGSTRHLEASLNHVMGVLRSFAA